MKGPRNGQVERLPWSGCDARSSASRGESKALHNFLPDSTPVISASSAEEVIGMAMQARLHSRPRAFHAKCHFRSTEAIKNLFNGSRADPENAVCFFLLPRTMIRAGQT